MNTLSLKMMTGMGLLALLTLFSLSASATGVGSSGGADYEVKLNAWFTSDDLTRPVHVCVESTPNFGFDQIALKSFTQKAFQAWADYAKRVGATARGGTAPTWDGGCGSGPSDMIFGYRPATELVMLDHCDGTEDLTLYFGVMNSMIQQRKAKYSMPYAFSELVTPVQVNSRQETWSKGFIWIAPPGSADPALQSPLWTNYEGAPLYRTILHELGHVFGNAHHDNTIMREDIARQLREKTQASHANRVWKDFDPRYLEIDSYHYLAFRPELGFDLPMSPGVGSCNSGDTYCESENQYRMQFAYQRLMGSSLAASSFTASLIHEQKPLAYNYISRNPIELLGEVKLQITVNQGVQLLRFVPIAVLSASTSHDSLFKLRCGSEITSGRYTLLGNLIRPNGASSLYVLNLNDDGFSWFSLIDPNLNFSERFCQLRQFEGVCPILEVDYATFRGD